MSLLKLINKIYDQIILILLRRQINDRLAVKFLEVVSCVLHSNNEQ